MCSLGLDFITTTEHVLGCMGVSQHCTSEAQVPQGATQAVPPLGQAKAGVCLGTAAAAAASCWAAIGAVAGGDVYAFVNAAVQCEGAGQGSILSRIEAGLLPLRFLLPRSIGGLGREPIRCCC